MRGRVLGCVPRTLPPGPSPKGRGVTKIAAHRSMCQASCAKSPLSPWGRGRGRGPFGGFPHPAFRVALLALVLFPAARAHAAPAAIDLQRGDVRLQYAPQTGVTLAYRGVPVIVRSTVTLVTPGWKQTLFGGKAATPTVRQWSEGETRVGEAQSESAVFSGAYRLSLDADGATIA